MKKAVLAVAATLAAVIIVVGAFEANKSSQAAPVVQAQTASQTTAAAAEPAHERFAVALGSFTDDATAQAWVDKLKAVGVPAYIETVTQAGGPTVTKLRCGPFDSRADASAAIAKVREAGLSSGDASPALAPAPVAQAAPASDASAQIGEPAVMVKGSSSNCAYEGTMAGNAAKYADVEDERSRLRDARSGIPDAMYAANIKAIFENPDISKLNNEDVADLAEKACLSGTDLSTYKAPEPASTSEASAPVEAPDATPATYTTSFDCSKAKSDSEHLICENADLAEKDVQLAEVVKQASAHATDQAAFKDGLRQAWNQRQECHDKECVSKWYDDQISSYKGDTQASGDSSATGNDSGDDGIWYVASKQNGCVAEEDVMQMMYHMSGVNSPEKYVKLLQESGTPATMSYGANSKNIALVNDGGGFMGFARGKIMCLLAVSKMHG